ncbi:MAG: HD domain-containing protein [Peptostreptococcaceae bacterium]
MFNTINEILLKKDNPSLEIKKLREELLKSPLKGIIELEEIDQNKTYHPEGDVLNHVLLVVDKASNYKFYSKDPKVFMWSSLLHDIGKLTTTKIINGKISSPNHDIVGEKMALDILNEINDNLEFNIKVSKYVKHHMQPLFFNLDKRMFKKEEILSEVDYEELALLSICDRLGRGGFDKYHEIQEINLVKEFYDFMKNR